MKIKHYQVLCVDDHDANLFSLEQLLKSIPEVEVVKALSGKEALNILLTHSIDMILLDIQMPEMDGYEVAQLVKQNTLTKEIPIIFLTAVFKSEEFIEKGFKVGAIDYLTKPLDDNQLLNRIQLYLNIFKERDRAIFLHNEYQSITDFMGEGLFVLNEEQKIIYINQAALKQLGFSHRELMGENIHDIVHYKDKNEKLLNAEDCPIRNIFLTKESIFTEEVFVKKDGTSFVALVSASPIFDEDKIIKIIVIFRDISEKITHKKELLKLEQERSKDHQDFINSLVNMIEARDTYTAGHSQRVSQYCQKIAQKMDFSKDEIRLLVDAAKLHDIGKISTPDSILLKPNKLEKLEYELIQYHLDNGYKILNSIESYRDIAEIMKYHHEHYDGSGYPSGFKGDEIPLLAHVMIVADAIDAMTSNRIYKPRMSFEETFDELRKESAKQFHPLVVDAAIEAIDAQMITQTTTQLPQNDLEHHRFSYFFKDKLTGLYLPEYEHLIISLYYHDKIPYRYIIRLLEFNEFNKEFGWTKGDTLLKEFSNWLQSTYEGSIIFRIEGDDFMILNAESIDVNESMILKDSPIAGTQIGVEVS